MSDSKANSGSNAKESAKQEVSPDAPGFTELLKAQIRLIAAQRNMNIELHRYRDAQQETVKAEAEFNILREKVQRESGLVYNDEKLSLENKSDPKTLQ
jgi:hypothetical protein